MKKRFVIALFCCSLFGASLSAQIVNGLDTLYGSEWITNENPYLRLTVGADGFYRIPYETIAAAGWPLATITANRFQLFYQGQQLHLYASNDGQSPLAAGDYLLFYGTKNRGELDRHLYRDSDNEQLNPYYSLYSDQAAYYLTWSSSGGLAYDNRANDLSAPPAPEPYVWRISEQVFGTSFMKEYYRFSGSTLYYSHFGIGEGYGNRSVNQLLADGSTAQTVTLPLPAAYAAGPAAGPAPALETRYTAALFEHLQRLSVNGQELRTDTFNNWRLLNVATPLPTSVLAAGEARLDWEGFAGTKDEVSVGFARVSYPAVPDAQGATAFNASLEASATPQYVELANYGASAAVVYDLTNGYRIAVDDITGGLLRVLLPPSATTRQLRIIAADAAAGIPPVSPVNLALPDLGNANYVILTHSQLRSGPNDPVQAYADYRASAAGGSYQTAIVNIDDLFDQFAYGVQQHPLAIRNFVLSQLRDNPNFQYLFLIGKGREYPALRTDAQLAAALGTTLFVPAFGYPASDNLLVSRLDKPTPLVSIGRLPAINAAEVQLYLNKIRGMENLVAAAPQTIEGKSWMKHVLHLGGGSTASEQQSIKNNLGNMAAEVEEGKFGAEVTSFYKTSTDPIQTSQTDQIFNRINEGVSLITFFGHSSAGSFDFSIDRPENYHNLNKYPLMISLGCYSGNMFDSFRSVGEEFIFLEDGGAGAFGASRGLGFIHALGNFGKTFHELMANDFYGQPIGEGIQATIRQYENFTDQAYGTLNEQFSLQGDPAFRLNPLPGEDYTIDVGSVKFTPSVVNVQQDSFLVNFDLVNIGSYQSDSIDLQVGQILPDGREIIYFVKRVATCGYACGVEMRIPSLGKAAIGINRLTLVLDPVNNIMELPLPTAENNNRLQQENGSLGVPFYVIDNTAIPVWPPEYALVGQAPVTLKASTANALAPERKYYWQLDTNPLFTQPIASTEMVQKGGVLKWTPSIPWQDSTVYYWRISPDSVEVGTPGFVWETSSFQLVAGIPSGWEQADWGQLGDNDLNNILIDTLGGKLIFDVNTRDVAIRNKVYSASDPPTFFDTGQYIGSPWTWSIYEGINIAVLPYPALDYWRNPLGGLYGSVNTATGWESVVPFAYRTAELADRTNLIQFLTEIVPDSFYVMIYSAQRTMNSDYHPELWTADSLVLDGKNIFNVLEAEGSIRVRELATRGSLPYVLFYQKGVGFIGEALAEMLDGDVILQHGFKGPWYEGEMVTIPVGPVSKWNTLNLAFVPTTLEAADSIRVTLEGSTNQADWETLWETEGPPEPFYTHDLTTVSSSTYPYLRVRYFAYDLEKRTIPKIKYLHIYHDPLAELAINPGQTYIFRDSIQEGEPVELIYAIENLGVEEVQDVNITYQLNNFTSGEVPDKIISRLAPDEVFLDTLNLASAGVKGTFEIITTVNPTDVPKEYARFNNTNASKGHVSSDKVDPVLDIIFDGQHILAGDIVAPRPHIVITLEDENLLLGLEDPSLVKLYLKRPDQGTFAFVESSDYAWTPASLQEGKNQARIDFQPELLIDGTYTLKVQAKDASENVAGKVELSIDFEVINRQTISQVLPYPNPFTDQARFVYTITGEPPADFALQIMTIAGRVVREVSKEEFGELLVGTHLSDFVWDGTDTYGDRLANGVYLYRVVAQDDSGNDLEIRDNGSSGYFTNGIGKVVLLR
ncbi:MAG: hypothetical protein DA408_11235 [Bacteroidetes bacterium]|nr:MAG: hypothetical protein C7N36_16435 [Bacteroidota bacterium]PTM12248.1 MAG: hypothetical protein DA408_11235 [Bacteroidota bacterium]